MRGAEQRDAYRLRRSSSGDYWAALERYVAGAVRRYRSDAELRSLVGTEVPAAAIWRMREALDAAGYRRVRIVSSSGSASTSAA